MILHGFSGFLSDLCYWVLGDNDEMFEDAISLYIYIVYIAWGVGGEWRKQARKGFV
jgi:carbohydrate-binding DOMON domain-containing protein